MAGRTKNAGQAPVSPASVTRELGLLRTVLSYGARELGVSDWSDPFDRLPIAGLTASTGARVADREKVDALPAKIVAAMSSKLSGDLALIWRLLAGTGCRLAEVTGLRVEDVILEDGEVIRETVLSGRTRGRIDRFTIFGCPDGAVSLSVAMAGVIEARSASRFQGAG